MKHLFLSLMIMSSATLVMANELDLAQFEQVVEDADSVTQCESCQRDRDEGSQLYNLTQALIDIKSDKLTYVGRDYPFGSLGAGGNLSCIYKNKTVYVEMEGCRPPVSKNKIGALRIKIYRLDGRLLDVYVDNEGVNPLPIDNPRNAYTFSLISKKVQPLNPGLSFMDVSREIEGIAKRYSDPYCSYTKSSVKCLNGASEDSSLAAEHQNPGRMVRELHDLVQAVPR